jgi:decaprenyl-phosphate phosphoribosyltransferase
LFESQQRGRIEFVRRFVWTHARMSNFIRAVVQLLRPKSWIKNSVVLLGVVSTTPNAHAVFSWRVAVAITCFCVISSAGYIINDVLDADRDRSDPLKRMRPIAARQIAVTFAIVAAGILSAVAVVLATVMGPSFLLDVAAYFALSVAYSLYLKNVAYVEIITVVTCFLLRLDAGVAVVAGPREPLLFASLACAITFLAAGKRAHELQYSPTWPQARPVLVGYSAVTLRNAMFIAGFVAMSLFAGYCVTATGTMPAAQKAVTLPFVGLGFARYLFLIVSRRASTGDPTTMVTADPILRFTLLLWIATIAVLAALHR